MRHVLTLLARELAAYFLGPMAYLVLLAFQFIAFLNFWELVDILSAPRSELSSLRDPMNTYISGSPAFWIAILVVDSAADDAALRRGAPPGHDRDPADRAGDRDRGRRRQVARRRGHVLRASGPVLPLSAVPVFPGEVRLRPGADHEPVRRPHDDGDDVCLDRLVLELADAQSDHRGDLDVRRACWS